MRHRPDDPTRAVRHESAILSADPAVTTRPNDTLYVSTILYVSAIRLAEASRFFQILSGVTGTFAIPRTLLGNFPSGS